LEQHAGHLPDLLRVVTCSHHGCWRRREIDADMLDAIGRLERAERIDRIMRAGCDNRDRARAGGNVDLNWVREPVRPDDRIDLDVPRWDGVVGTACRNEDKEQGEQTHRRQQSHEPGCSCKTPSVTRLVTP
jgi:hypothetical protein